MKIKSRMNWVNLDAGAGAGENSKCYQETELANAFTELGKAMPIMPFEMEVAPLISVLGAVHILRQPKTMCLIKVALKIDNSP